MKGDFTRVTFDRTKHFSRVLKQQGRVTIEADDNEQTAILLHYLQSLARDLIGPYGTPGESPGFRLRRDEKDNLAITSGHYYVDGILVENDKETAYADQSDYPLLADDALAAVSRERTGAILWVYLDVWERHITAVEDETIREKALNGPDTCTRAKVVWQVKSLRVEDALRERTRHLTSLVGDDELAKTEIAKIDKALEMLGSLRAGQNAPDPILCETPLGLLASISSAGLSGRVDPGKKTEDACVMPPDSKYRGAENQLYRVEIHDGSKDGKEATFKWSRDNGSVATAWLGTAGSDLRVSHARGFEAGNWVELSHDDLELQGKPGVLVKVIRVQGDALSVDPASGLLPWSKDFKNPKVRRWDQVQTEEIQLRSGAVAVEETPAEAKEEEFVWIDLEDGIQVRFTANGQYRTGDYWLIPARVATGKIEWPDGMVRQPQGIDHHYAPLGFVWWKDGVMQVKSCVCDFKPLSSCSSRNGIIPPPHPRPPIKRPRLQKKG